jgi:hypothetical protein
MLVLLVVISSLFVYVVANITEKRTASTPYFSHDFGGSKIFWNVSQYLTTHCCIVGGHRHTRRRETSSLHTKIL